MPEVPNNIDMTTGNLGLTDQEEDQIVTFLQTLTDGFTSDPVTPDINTFTGACMTGGSAATQGNEFLIPTPPLPPCAAAICGVAPTPEPSYSVGKRRQADARRRVRVRHGRLGAARPPCPFIVFFKGTATRRSVHE